MNGSTNGVYMAMAEAFCQMKMATRVEKKGEPVSSIFGGERGTREGERNSRGSNLYAYVPNIYIYIYM